MVRVAFASPPSLTSIRTLRRHFSVFAAVNSKIPEMPRHHHHSSLEVIGGGSDRFLPALKESLAKAYDAFPLIGFNRHVETIYAAFFRSVPSVKLRRECLRTKDDGSVALDWVAGDDGYLLPESPILILLVHSQNPRIGFDNRVRNQKSSLLSLNVQPGLTGGSQDSYVRHMLLRARSRNWRCVVFNSRGCGDSPVTTPQV